MIDAHAHLHDKKFDADRFDVIKRAFDGGLTQIVNIGTSVEESHAAVAVAEQHENIFATVGIHPHSFNDEKGVQTLQEDIVALRAIAQNSQKIVAVGETGLDYYDHGGGVISPEQRGWQKEGLLAQVALAQELGIPIVIHCRDAYEDLYEILKAYSSSTAFVIHCYMGSLQMTEQFLSLDTVYFSFTGNITFSKSDDDEMSTVVRRIPLERMMVETDCPYLTPVPHRGKRNEPAYVQHVAKHIAYLKGQPVEVIATQTDKNTKSFFQIR